MRKRYLNYEAAFILLNRMALLILGSLACHLFSYCSISRLNLAKDGRPNMIMLITGYNGL